MNKNVSFKKIKFLLLSSVMFCTIQLIQAQNLKINKLNSENVKTFLSALERSNMEQMKMMLESNLISANQSYTDNESTKKPILTAAILLGNSDAVELLIKYGADVNQGFQVEQRHYNPYGGKYGVGGSEIQYITVYPINILLDNYNDKILKQFMDKGVKLNPAIDQIKSKDFDFIKYFSQFIDLAYNTDDLNAAIKNNELKKAFFLAQLVKPNSQSLIYAIRIGKMPLFDTLINHGADINEYYRFTTKIMGQPQERHWLPICEAIWTKNLDFVKKTVDNGANLNCYCNYVDGTTVPNYNPVQLSNNKGSREITDFLVLAPAYLKNKQTECVNKAEKYLKNGNNSLAEKEYESLYLLLGNKGNKGEFISNQIIEVGNKLYEKGKIDSALQIYNYSRKYLSNSYFIAMGNLQIKTQQYNKSIQYFDTVSNRNNINQETRGLIDFYKGISFLYLSNNNQALTLFEELKAISKKHPQLANQSNIAFYYYYSSQNNLKKSLSCLKKALKNGYKGTDRLEAYPELIKNTINSPEYLKIKNEYNL